MEFVDCRAGGAPGPECPGPGCPGPSGLPRAAYLLGRLLSFDLLVNNWDRLPVGGAWATHTGNPGNILWAPAGAAAGAACPASVLPVAIDFAIQPITSPAALAEYVDRVRAIMRMVLARYCAELAEDATSAAALGRLRATAGAWLRATCPADEAPPADPTNKAMGDVFWAARAELREHANMCASATGPNLDTDILNTHLARGLAQHALFSMVRLAPEIGLWQEARRSEAPPEGGQDAWVPWAEALLSACTLPDPGPGDLLDALRLPPVSLEAMLTEARVELGPPPGGVSTPGSPARGSADAAPSVPPALPPKAAHESGLLSRGATLTDGIETMRMVAGGGLFLALVDTARALAAGHAWRLESPPQ
ncbi:hypothetical protein H696_05503 [Fonticula alba]|uniref:Actin-fragmin kinase catalytic domain-containing protein n=1 Tax=Fonticula alba TaxID=691883 RepID=A0A058Z1B7_FONAL|nr:hypothetical protein H696_05503 [Fonticula alba]KCV68035.1 hypothetical protein H696_05503 [Fonticula alba]|eukprot:XP_009497602.1 hypothetical protein H696_05503 [Fonticula alba]